MSSREFASLANVSWATIKRFELADGIPPSRAGTLERVQAALVAEGIEFIGDPITSPDYACMRGKILADMSEPRPNTLRRSLVVTVILVMSGFTAFGPLQRDGWAFNEYDAYLHFAAFAAVTLLAAIVWPRAGLGQLFAGLAALAGVTELLQIVPGLNRTPSLSDFSFNICGIVAVLGIVTAGRALAPG